MAQQQRRASTSALTFPILTWKEVTDLLSQALGINISQAETSNPSPATVARIYNAMLELVTGLPRSEVSEILQRAMQTLEMPDIYRDGLTQLTLLREMEVLCGASLLSDFRLDDLVTPTGPRFLKIMSAILNFGRFREDIMRQHEEQMEGVAKLEKELTTLKECEVDLQESIRRVNERLAEEEPERKRLLNDIQREQASLNGLFADNSSLEKALNEQKKREQELKTKCDSMLLEISKIEGQTNDIRSQLVSSPERIQAGIQQLRRRVDQEREELERLKEQERALKARAEDLHAATSGVEDCLARIANVEEKADEAQREEEQTRARKATIDSHQRKVLELKQQEQAALREVRFAEERNNRMASQKAAQIKSAKDVLRHVTRELENRERHASDDIRKASRLRAEISSLKAQLEKQRLEHENSYAMRNSEFGHVVAAFEAYAETLVSTVNVLDEASQITSTLKH
jgi:kinetochore protein Nuf2